MHAWSSIFSKHRLTDLPINRLPMIWPTDRPANKPPTLNVTDRQNSQKSDYPSYDRQTDLPTNRLFIKWPTDRPAKKPTTLNVTDRWQTNRSANKPTIRNVTDRQICQQANYPKCDRPTEQPTNQLPLMYVLYDRHKNLQSNWLPVIYQTDKLVKK